MINVKIFYTLFTIIPIISAIVPESCKSNYLLYKELGCRPMNVDAQGCPSYYDCNHLDTRDAKACYYKKEKAPIGQSLDTTITSLAGRASCFCTSSPDGKPNLVCAQIECARLFNRYPDPGCYYKYELGSYCETGTICSKQLINIGTFNKTYNSIIASDSKASINCLFNNKTVLYGEKYYPTGYHECFCNEQYDPSNPLSDKTCREIECGFGFRIPFHVTKSCVPVYYKTVDGCAIEYKCFDSSKSYTILDAGKKAVETGGRVYAEGKCKFGDLVMDKLEILKENGNEECVECSCNMPPMITCAQTCDHRN